MDFRKGFKSTNKVGGIGFHNWVVLDDIGRVGGIGFHNYYKQWKRPSLRLNIARLEDKGNPWSTKHCRKYIQ